MTTLTVSHSNSSSISSSCAPDCLFAPLIVSNGAVQGVDWAAVQELLLVRGTHISLTELQTHDALRSAQLAAADSAGQAEKDSRVLLPDSCIEAALQAGDFTPLWAPSGSTDATAGALGAARPPEGNQAASNNSSSRPNKRPRLSTQPQPQAAAAEPGALPPAALQPPGAAAAGAAPGSPAAGQQKQQLLQQYVQRLLLVSDAAVRVESLEQAFDLRQRLEDLADNSKWAFPVPPVELLLLVTSGPSQQDAFDNKGLRFFGSAVLKCLVVAGLLQVRHRLGTQQTVWAGVAARGLTQAQTGYNGQVAQACCWPLDVLAVA